VSLVRQGYVIRVAVGSLPVQAEAFSAV
jgi:hypothetical protein